MPDYPKREPYFAHKAIRLMFKSCAIMDMGDLAALIVTMVALQEDASRYRGPVRFWNCEFRNTLGASEGRINRARKKAVAAGWLHYISRGTSTGNNRTVGDYWVTIPPGLEGLDDSPVGEVITNAGVGSGEGIPPVITNTGEGKADGMVKGFPLDSRGDSRGNGVDTSILTLNPDPSPTPDPKKVARKRAPTTRFIPPTVEQVRAYCERRGNSIDPEYFVDHYVTRGWKLKGGNPVKDWKACVRTWEGMDRQRATDKQKPLYDVPALPVTDGSDEV